MRKASLVWKFGVLGVVCFALLGLIIARTIGQTIRAHHLSTAQREAEVLTEVGVLSRLDAKDLSRTLDFKLRMQLDKTLRSQLDGSGGESVRIYGSDGALLYSSDPVADPGAPVSEGLRLALAGESATAQAAEIFSVYVPITFSRSLVPDGAVEVRKPFAPMDREIDAESRPLFAIVGAGLLVLYLVLFRLVAKSSRRLRKQVEDNERQALHDPLTDLPNRILFRIASGRRSHLRRDRRRRSL